MYEVCACCCACVHFHSYVPQKSIIFADFQKMQTKFKLYFNNKNTISLCTKMQRDVCARTFTKMLNCSPQDILKQMLKIPEQHAVDFLQTHASELLRQLFY